jgi:hypothetical protein
MLIHSLAKMPNLGDPVPRDVSGRSVAEVQRWRAQHVARLSVASENTVETSER